MDEKSERQTARKVGYVSAVCATVGVLLGWGAKLQFNLDWWIVPVMTLAAGALAWLMYDFAGVLAGVKKAWREVTEWRPGWSRVARFFKIWFYLGVTFHGLVFCIGYFVFFVAILAVFNETTTVRATGVPDSRFDPFLFFSVMEMGLWFVFGFAAITMSVGSESETEESVRESRYLALIANPISIPFTVVYFLAKGLIWMATRIPGAMMIMANGICRLVIISFVLIHSEERRVCFTATGLGTAIGLITCYQHGNAFFGAAIGAAVGGVFGRLECRWGKRLADKLAMYWLRKEAI